MLCSGHPCTTQEVSRKAEAPWEKDCTKCDPLCKKAALFSPRKRLLFAERVTNDSNAQLLAISVALKLLKVYQTV